MPPTFQVRVNGEPVYETNKRVARVSLRSAKGEAGVLGAGDINSCDIVVEHVDVGQVGVPTLQDTEEFEREVNREFAREKQAERDSSTVASADVEVNSPPNVEPVFADDPEKLARNRAKFFPTETVEVGEGEDSAEVLPDNANETEVRAEAESEENTEEDNSGEVSF